MYGTWLRVRTGRGYLSFQVRSEMKYINNKYFTTNVLSGCLLFHCAWSRYKIIVVYVSCAKL